MTPDRRMPPSQLQQCTRSALVSGAAGQQLAGRGRAAARAASGSCLALTLLAAAACADGPEDPYIQAEGRTTQALITIQRSTTVERSVARSAAELVRDAEAAERGVESVGATPPTEATVIDAAPSETSRITDGATAYGAAMPTSSKSTAHALAHFVNLPLYSEPDRVLGWAGLVRALPAVDECRVYSRAEVAERSLATLGHLELLEAGAVEIATENTRSTLAPRAFPAVSELVSGVVYTTRDQSLDPLPAGVSYRINVSGAGDVPRFSLEADAPEPLTLVTVGGFALSELATLVSGSVVDVTWNPGRVVRTGAAAETLESDRVVVELTSDFDQFAVRCAFRDDLGTGSVPAELTRGLGGEGRLVVHRVRHVDRAVERVPGTDETRSGGSRSGGKQAEAEFDSARIEFDLDLSRNIEFVTRTQ